MLAPHGRSIYQSKAVALHLTTRLDIGFDTGAFETIKRITQCCVILSSGTTVCENEEIPAADLNARPNLFPPASFLHQLRNAIDEEVLNVDCCLSLDTG